MVEIDQRNGMPQSCFTLALGESITLINYTGSRTESGVNMLAWVCDSRPKP